MCATKKGGTPTIQVGIVSSAGNDSCQGSPSFTRVSYYYKWINKTIGEMLAGVPQYMGFMGGKCTILWRLRKMKHRLYLSARAYTLSPCAILYNGIKRFWNPFTLLAARFIKHFSSRTLFPAALIYNKFSWLFTITFKFFINVGKLKFYPQLGWIFITEQTQPKGIFGTAKVSQKFWCFPKLSIMSGKAFSFFAIFKSPCKLISW